MRDLAKIFGLTCLMGLFLSCERAKPPTKKENLRSPVDQKTEMEVFRNGDNFNVKYKLQYQNDPVDFLIIRDVGGNFTGENEGEKLKSAMKTLAARMQFATFDARIIIANATAIGSQSQRGDDGKPLPLFSDLDGPVALGPDQANLAELLAKRLGSADRYYGGNLQPLSSIKSIVEAAQKNGAIRSGARLGILMMQLSSGGEEAVAPESLSRYLNEKVGSGKWKIAALTTTAAESEKGCSGANTFVNLLDRPIADRVLEEDQRPLIKLALSSTGLIVSPCQPSYLMFFDRYFLESSDQEHVKVNLPEAALWRSIKVLVDGVEYLGWKYEPGSKQLKLWRVFPPGKEFNVIFTKDVKGDPQDIPVVEPISERQLTPDELEFNTSANSVLFRYCNDCHGQVGPQKQYVGSYLNAKANKAAILDRVTKPDTDALRMPPQKVPVDQASLDALTQWLKK